MPIMRGELPHLPTDFDLIASDVFVLAGFKSGFHGSFAVLLRVDLRDGNLAVTEYRRGGVEIVFAANFRSSAVAQLVWRPVFDACFLGGASDRTAVNGNGVGIASHTRRSFRLGSIRFAGTIAARH